MKTKKTVISWFLIHIILFLILIQSVHGCRNLPICDSMGIKPALEMVS